MPSAALSPDQYIDEVPKERRAAMRKLRQSIKQNLPKGFKEVMSYGMIGYVVPHALYPAGYHCDPKLPLPYMSIASQKNFIAVYHMGMYADADMLQWFQDAYQLKAKGKLDMGKSCIRFKNLEEIPFDLVGDLTARMTPEQWIVLYESQVKDARKK